MGGCKSRLEVKRCSCDELVQSDSLNAVIRTRVSCRSTDSRNHNRHDSNPHEARKKRSLNSKNDYRKFPNKYEPPRKPNVNKSSECKCYTALTGQKYSVDALTPEEQFEVVEKVFREKKSGSVPTQINRRSSQNNRHVNSASARESVGDVSVTASLTDTSRAFINDSPSPAALPRGCRPDCRCGGRKSSAQSTLEVERRNGLQNVGHSNAGCQCVLYDGRVGRLRKEELSQAQAIAIAVREYCAQRRKRMRGRGDYCMCNKDVLPKPQWEEDEELERKSQRRVEEKNVGRKNFVKKKASDVELENEADDNIEEDMEEGEHEDESEAERAGDVELEEKINERMMSRAEDDEPFKEAQREKENYLPETLRRLRDSEKIDPESGKRSSRHKRHAEKDKRKHADEEKQEYADEDEDTFSLSDIKLEVHTVVSTTQDSSRHAPTKPQSRQSPTDNAARRPSDLKRSSHRHEQQRSSLHTTDEEKYQISHEEEVLVKKTNLAPRSPHERKRDATKSDREQPSDHGESEESIGVGEKRRVSAESVNGEKECKCCNCDKATMTEKKGQKTTEMGFRTKPDEQESNTDENFDAPRHKEYETRTRRSIESETKPEREKKNRDKWEPKDAYAVVAGQLNREGQREKAKEKRRCCCRGTKEGEEKNFKPCCPCKKDETTASEEEHSEKRTKRESGLPHNKGRTERTTTRSSERRPNNSEGDERRSTVRRRSSRSKAEKECQTYCHCKKTKGVPLTKCCTCREELAYSTARQQDEDMKRRKLAEELADRLQRRAELQVALQKRLQEQLRAKQKQCCCCAPPPCCYPQYQCCEMRPTEPMSCYEAMQSSPCGCCPTPPCCAATSCCPTTACCPPCCCEPPPAYGQECPCCCQPLKYCYPPSCAYPRAGL